MARRFNFVNFGNLFYFKELKPDYFYFNILLNSYERNAPNPKYREMANRIGNDAISMLSNVPGITQEDDQVDFNQQYSEIIKILQAAIEQERANEEQFVRSKIAMLENNFDPKYVDKQSDIMALETMLETLGSGGGINYDTFIRLINVLQQGLKNTKSIFKFEAEHLEELEQARVANAAALENQIRGLARSRGRTEDEANNMVNKALQKRDKIRVNAYLKKHNIMYLRGFKKYMKGMETVDNKIADWIKEQVNIQLTNNISTYESIIKSNPDDKRSIGEQIRSKLVLALTEKSAELLPQILNEEAIDINAITQDIVTNFNQPLQVEISGIPESFGINKKHIKFFEENISKNKSNLRSAANLYDILVQLMGKLDKIDPSNYSPDQQMLDTTLGSFYQSQIKQIQQLMKKISRINRELTKNPNKTAEFSRANNDPNGELILTVSTQQDGKVVSSKQINLSREFQNANLNIFQSKNGALPKSLSSVLTTIKTNASQKIRDELTNLISNPQLTRHNNQLHTSLQQAMQNIQVSVTGDQLEELFQGMDHTFTKKLLTGGTWSKNDFMEIVVGMPQNVRVGSKLNKIITDQLDTTINKTDIIFKAFSDIMTNFQNDFAAAIQSNMRDIQSSKEWTNYDLMAKQYFETTAEKTKAIEKIKQAYEEMKKKIENSKSNAKNKEKRLQQLTAARDACLASIENTIVESSTMKTVRTYQNDIGFIGGSLGPTVDQQINSFKQIFAAAGVPISDSLSNWLISAIINCSPISVVGEQHKDFIENYLGSLAIFAMFSEGGAELKMLRAQLDNQSTTTNDIMHLYKVNGLYYPGSFILQQVLNNLVPFMEVINQTEHALANRNVMITNNASLSMLPNQKNSKHSRDTHPWETVSQAVSKGTSIKVLFLAGLLDVVKRLHEQMEEIELPTT